MSTSYTVSFDAAAATPAVDVRGLRKSFGDHRVLDGIDLSVAAGEVYGLLGPNGAGKTTLVRILTTLSRPDGGSARVAGHDVVTAPVAVRRAISLTGQFTAVDDLLTGAENLRMLGRLRGLGRTAARERTGELLARFDLADAAERRVATYSGGMRRRLDLAMSLVVEPRVLFLDEPTTGLDPRSRQDLWRVVERLRDGGTTILLTTQYLDEADALADRVGVIAGGRLVAEGTVDDVKATVGTEVVEVTYPDARTVRLPTDGTVAHLRGLLDELDDLDGPMAAAARVQIRRPSLDDAFMALTGGDPSPLDPQEVPVP